MMNNQIHQDQFLLDCGVPQHNLIFLSPLIQRLCVSSWAMPANAADSNPRHYTGSAELFPHPFSFPSSGKPDGRVYCFLCVSALAHCPLGCQEKQDENCWDKTIPVSQILLHESFVLNLQFVSSVSHLLERLSGGRTLLPPVFLQHISLRIVTRSQSI